MKFYGVKIYNLLQFDYYGESVFVIKIFKDTAIECTYPTEKVEVYFQNAESQRWKKDQYILDSSSLEYEKVCALWIFNAYHNYAKYVEIQIKNMNIDLEMNNMVSKFCFSNNKYTI